MIISVLREKNTLSCKFLLVLRFFPEKYPPGKEAMHAPRVSLLPLYQIIYHFMRYAVFPSLRTRRLWEDVSSLAVSGNFIGQAWFLNLSVMVSLF